MENKADSIKSTSNLSTIAFDDCNRKTNRVLWNFDWSNERSVERRVRKRFNPIASDVSQSFSFVVSKLPSDYSHVDINKHFEFALINSERKLLIEKHKPSVIALDFIIES